jgi:hypothetical protein
MHVHRRQGETMPELDTDARRAAPLAFRAADLVTGSR